jgi:hypothetical protein
MWKELVFLTKYWREGACDLDGGAASKSSFESPENALAKLGVVLCRSSDLSGKEPRLERLLILLVRSWKLSLLPDSFLGGD